MSTNATAAYQGTDPGSIERKTALALSLPRATLYLVDETTAYAESLTQRCTGGERVSVDPRALPLLFAAACDVRRVAPIDTPAWPSVGMGWSA